MIFTICVCILVGAVGFGTENPMNTKIHSLIFRPTSWLHIYCVRGQPMFTHLFSFHAYNIEKYTAVIKILIITFLPRMLLYEYQHHRLFYVWVWTHYGRLVKEIVHVWIILIMKANKMHYFSNLFDKVLYMFQTCPLSIIKSIWTLYTLNRYLSF